DQPLSFRESAAEGSLRRPPQSGSKLPHSEAALRGAELDGVSVAGTRYSAHSALFGTSAPPASLQALASMQSRAVMPSFAYRQHTCASVQPPLVFACVCVAQSVPPNATAPATAIVVSIVPRFIGSSSSARGSRSPHRKELNERNGSSRNRMPPEGALAQ